MTESVRCYRRRQTARMTADAVQLTIVFSIVPVIPFVLLETHSAYGVWGLVIAATLFYVGYPLTFGALMWCTCPREEGKT